jgi:predicted nuclease of predicted toxin-antitoxin system
MKIKLDENLPASLAPSLVALGHDARTVISENLRGHPDQEVWGIAQEEERFFITQDLDFSDARQFAPGRHNGILLIRLRSPDRRSLLARVHRIFEQEDVAKWRGCFVVASDRKIRVLRPGTV